MAGRLEGRVAIVTGADSGIGRAIAIEFANEGADIAITYRDDGAGAEETKAAVEAAGRRALALCADQRRPEPVQQAFRDIEATLGAPYILVNNAGVFGPDKPVAETSPEEWDDILRANLYGPFYFCRLFVPARRRAGGGGRILNVTSVHEEIPSGGNEGAAYDASKGGLRNLTRALSLELAGDGINVVNIAPGMILTPMNQSAIDDPEQYRRQVANIPVGRAGQPWEVARLALYLASDDAGFITGQTFFIDGGQTMNVGQGA